jgi:signal transduction histidine kinase
VALHADGDAIKLEVCDAGIGFDAADAQAGPGVGLVSMRERINRAGGTFEVITHHRAGTIVRARVPIVAASPRAALE